MLAACGQSNAPRTLGKRAQPLEVSVGVYEIINRQSGKALDVQGWSSEDGALIQQYTPSQGDNQRWQLTRLDDGSYKITAQHSNKVLDVFGVSGDDGALIQQYTWSGGDNQRWNIIDTSDGFVKLSARHSGKVLDIKDGASTDGALIQQWQDYGSVNQQWKLVRVGGNTQDGEPLVLDPSGRPIVVPDTNYAIPTGALFVAPWGNDETGDGSQERPWKSVTRALESAPQGATLVFRGGTYRPVHTDDPQYPGNAAAENKRLTLQAYPHEQVWLKGSEVVTGWVQDGSAWRKDGWTYKFPSDVPASWIPREHPQAGERDMVFVDGRALQQVGGRSELRPGTFFLDAQQKQLFLGENPNGRIVEVSVQERAWWLGWGYFNGAGTVVRGLGFAHYSSNGLEMGVDYITLENNAFVWNASMGVNLLGSDPSRESREGISRHDVVRGNLFAYNGRNGLSASRTHDLRVANNIFRGNNTEGFTLGDDAAGFKFTGADRVTVENNLVEDNPATGIWMDIGVRQARIVNNIIRRNVAAGISFEISDGAIIAGNIVVDNGGQGLTAGNSANTRVYNNTFVNNGRAVEIGESDRPADGKSEEYPGQGVLGPNWDSHSNVLKNNIFAGATWTNPPFNGEPDVVDVVNWPLDPNDKPMISAMDRNAYVRPNPASPWTLIRWTQQTADRRSIHSLADFRSAVGFEWNGVEFDNMPLTSVFVNPAADDYRLKDGSSLKWAGEALPQDVADALGVPAGQAMDLGALKH